MELTNLFMVSTPFLFIALIGVLEKVYDTVMKEQELFAREEQTSLARK